MTAANEDISDFLNNVDEVSRLIDGLKAGTISAQYVDSKYLNKESKQANDVKPRTSPGQLQPIKPANQQSKQDTSRSKVSNPEEEGDAKREALLEKVKELQANREKKLKARERYNEYVQDQDKRKNNATGIPCSTDYTKWDMWCPEDEEDDLFNSLTPNNPGFKALEKDIDDRHKRMVEQRQLAERARVAGNEAFKAGQYSEALRCYQQGLESEKTNMALHANAAQAALNIHCYVQAIEHCDKVLNIADFLHNNMKHPLCAKAYMRRGMAYRALSQHQQAVDDVAAALAIDPTDQQLLKLKQKVDLDLEEHKKQKDIRKAMKKGTPDSTHSQVDIVKLGKVEQLVQQLGSSSSQNRSSPIATSALSGNLKNTAIASNATQADSTRQDGTSAPNASDNGQLFLKGPKLPSRNASSRTSNQLGQQQGCAAEQLDALLSGDDVCCVYFRECGGLSASLSALQTKSLPESTGKSTELNVLRLLNTASSNDGNLTSIAKLQGMIPAVLQVLIGNEDTGARIAAATLLCTLSTAEEARKAVSTALASPPTLQKLVDVLCSAAAPLRSLLLLLLDNCAVDSSCRSALHPVLKCEGCNMLRLLETCISMPEAGVACERAATLVTNMCSSDELRSCLSGNEALVRALLMTMLGKSSVNALACQQAAATALSNLCVNTAAQQTIGHSDKLPALIAMLSGDDWVLIARAATIMSRCCKQPTVAGALIKDGIGVTACCRLIERSLKHNGDNQGDKLLSLALSGAVGCLTVLLASNDSATVASCIVTSAGLSCLHNVLTLSSPQLQASRGNAALSIANIGKHTTMLPSLAKLCANAINTDDIDCTGLPSVQECKQCLIAALIRTAYEGQGTSIATNAGIALARLSAHPPLLARVKQLRGLEVIHASVKSLP